MYLPIIISTACTANNEFLLHLEINMQIQEHFSLVRRIEDSTYLSTKTLVDPTKPFNSKFQTYLFASANKLCSK